MKKKRILKWRKLDNSAKIFPISTGEKYSTVFRLSVVLKEDVDKTILQRSLNIALREYDFFKVKMKSGFFWNYFEYNNKETIVEEEKEYPCQYINPRTNNEYLLKVTYFKNKINMDIAHSLADGNSATIFFKEIIYTYLEKKYKEEFVKNKRIKRNIVYSSEDSYKENYDKELKGNSSSNKAYVIEGNKIPLEAVSVIHEIMNLEQLQKECEKNEATITQYLTAVLIYSIYKANYLNSRKKEKNPIKVCIPVNLRKYFNSETLSNFFSYITLECYMQNKNMNKFDEILTFVKEEFSKKLTKEEISKTMSANVKLGNNIFIKVIPLFIKKAIVRSIYNEIRKYTTITFSNIGRMGIIGQYRDYINYFMLLIAPEPIEKLKCSACSFENKIVFTITSILNNNSIEKNFYNFIKDKGIDIEVESNGVLDDISTKA